MPTISSAGIGSGLDVEGIIKGLVGVERQPIVKQIGRASCRERV